MDGNTSSKKTAPATVAVRFVRSKSFEKTVRLPIRGQFLFHEDDILISDSLFTYWKKKRLFYSTRSHGCYRELAVSYDGHLICYTERAMGYVLAIEEAISVKSASAPAFFGRDRVVLTLKFNFGSFYIYASNTRAHEWLKVLQGINVGLQKTLSMSSIFTSRTIDSQNVNYCPSMATLWEESSLRMTEISVLETETLKREEVEEMMSKEEQVGKFVATIWSRMEKKKVYEKIHLPEEKTKYKSNTYK